MSNTNFKEETLSRIKEAGKSLTDIWYIGTREYKVSMDDFWELADFEYDSGYGAPHIPGDLIVVFDDVTWLERHEYDGSEEWKICLPPSFPKEGRDITKIRNSGYKTLEETQEEEEDK